MNTRILFLDDSKERHEAFRLRTIGCDVTYVENYDEAIAALEHGPYDDIWLDHDLSPESSAGMPIKGEKTGYDVACAIAELAPEKRPRRGVFVHSMNGPGAARMVAALQQSGIKVARRSWLR